MSRNENGMNSSSIEGVKEKLQKNRDKILRDAKKIEAGLASFEESKNRKNNKRP